jgi:hypothetical protein
MNVLIDSLDVRAVAEKLIAAGIKPSTIRLTTASREDAAWLYERLMEVRWNDVRVIWMPA